VPIIYFENMSIVKQLSNHQKFLLSISLAASVIKKRANGNSSNSSNSIINKTPLQSDGSRYSEIIQQFKQNIISNSDDQSDSGDESRYSLPIYSAEILFDITICSESSNNYLMKLKHELLLLGNSKAGDGKRVELIQFQSHLCDRLVQKILLPVDGSAAYERIIEVIYTLLELEITNRNGLSADDESKGKIVYLLFILEGVNKAILNLTFNIKILSDVSLLRLDTVGMLFKVGAKNILNICKAKYAETARSWVLNIIAKSLDKVAKLPQIHRLYIEVLHDIVANK